MAGRDEGILSRHFTRGGENPYTRSNWKTWEIPGYPHPVEAPASWSANAVEIAATKYFRRAETSVRQLVYRVAKTLRRAGEWQGYFATTAEAQTFEDELTHILLTQKASFNSPVYFNVGLFPEYGVLGSGENFVFDAQAGQARALSSAYLHPQASACFIQDVKDDLISIFDLLKSEAKLFKYGSGTGTNFSRLRSKGEALDGGGGSTGLISYLEIFDKAAQAIKSGGTTRRAAKMVVLDADHPEIQDFVRWKMNEERKARVLLAAGFSGGMEGEAFRTVSGQNSNNSVRVTDEFLRRAQNGEMWALQARKGQSVVAEIRADALLREMARAAWECADPGIQYSDTIQSWHMCPRSGEIRASNPCSEYMFLDNSACNLASLNLVSFLREDVREPIDWPAFTQCVRVMLLAQEILVDYSSYPTAAIAENSHVYRPLGLGYANLGGLLMRLGLPYDSEEAAQWTTRLTAAMHALALETSQKMAATRGAFAGWQANRPEALAVIDKHKQAWQSSGVKMPWVEKTFSQTLKAAEKTGLRNAQVTLIAPTGTIGLFMDCDTLGIEPEFALVKRKSLAGGGEMKIVNHSVEPALRRLGYSAGQIQTIVAFVHSKGTVVGAPEFNETHAAIFDGALPPAGRPDRRVSPEGHLRVMAAAQPYLSGAISKTVNLPATATVEDVEAIFLRGWQLGLKALAIYRDGSKSLQPLCAEC
ncbi:MAG: vitamin B12-dependent ribonucleotide reductase [Bdellovibrionales bacterium]|nr:vitamin B12-dependent ribonucleotide reductase [Bdellovibrionales bacterium]